MAARGASTAVGVGISDAVLVGLVGSEIFLCQALGTPVIFESVELRMCFCRRVAKLNELATPLVPEILVVIEACGVGVVTDGGPDIIPPLLGDSQSFAYLLQRHPRRTWRAQDGW